MLKAFYWSKEALAQVVLLTHPHKGAPMALTTDASNEAVGAVLQQWIHKEWLPLAFFSKQLAFCPLPSDPAFQEFPGRKGVHSIHQPQAPHI